jgi:hypothetical protein
MPTKESRFAYALRVSIKKINKLLTSSCKNILLRSFSVGLKKLKRKFYNIVKNYLSEKKKWKCIQKFGTLM